MTRKNIQVLAAIVIVLILAILLMESTDDTNSASLDQALLPGFTEHANDAQRIHIVRSNTDQITLRRESDKWVISTREDYAADVGKLRQLIVALAEARIIEKKTSNPDLYQKLGVDDPEEDGSGTKVVIEGEDFSYAVILGESVQRGHRYARTLDDDASYLINTNPDVPEEVGDWLFPDIIDIDSKSIRKVTLGHENGETITIEKSTEELTDFSVRDIPEGRELSYATVGNGIAGALSQLELDDVRAATEGTPGTTAVFDTWDGLQVTARVITENDETWVAFSAEMAPGESAAESPDDINDRVSGWQYRLPDQKKDLLTRRWDDILKTADE